MNQILKEENFKEEYLTKKKFLKTVLELSLDKDNISDNCYENIPVYMLTTNFKTENLN